jgi:adenine deaminase
MKCEAVNTELLGYHVDVLSGDIRPSRVALRDGRIAGISEADPAHCRHFLVPGFIDAHVHIESSMLAPSAFARAAVCSGVVGTVSDPHEIANVLGKEGVLWMVEDGRRTPFKFHFGAPSCVPATPFETAGASFGPEDVADLLDCDGVHYLAEVMNFPAVIQGDERMSRIIAAARKRKRRIDGHAPGVMGEDLKQYAAAGIETDHECFTLEQGRARCRLGMKVAIREGSAARNFEALWPLLKEFPEHCFFCSDDKHPDDLVESYLNNILRRAVERGVPALQAIRAATLNPIRHYGISAGLLQPGDPADIVELQDLTRFRVLRTWIDGQLVAENGQTRLPPLTVKPRNRFHAEPFRARDMLLPWPEAQKPFPVIVAEDGQLMTGREDILPTCVEGHAVSDPARDLLKIVVVNRYNPAPPVIGLIRNFGLRHAALAGSVAHDSHNIVAVGANDAALVRAINAVIADQGGLSYADAHTVESIPLPIAGLMALDDAWTVGAAFRRLTERARADGCPLQSPYMTLSFMALLVIPRLKIGDRGLFDVDCFELVST